MEPKQVPSDKTVRDGSCTPTAAIGRTEGMFSRLSQWIQSSRFRVILAQSPRKILFLNSLILAICFAAISAFSLLVYVTPSSLRLTCLLLLFFQMLALLYWWDE
jgi:hypothetical protein